MTSLRRISAHVLLGVALVLVATMSSTGQSQAKIKINKSIAGVKLGMSPKQVRAVAGEWDHRKKWRSTGAMAWKYSFGLKVEFNKFRGRLRAEWIYTSSPKQRAANGLRVGRTSAQVDRLRGWECSYLSTGLLMNCYNGINCTGGWHPVHNPEGCKRSTVVWFGDDGRANLIGLGYERWTPPEPDEEEYGATRGAVDAHAQ